MQATREEMSSQMSQLLQHMSNLLSTRTNDIFTALKTENQTLRHEMDNTMRAEHQSLRENIDQMWDTLSQLQTQANDLRTETTGNNPPAQNRYRSPFSVQTHDREATIPASIKPPQKEQTTLRLQQNKAFKQVLSTANPKFNGKDHLEYAPWKKAFKIEIEDLHRSATHQLQL